ncbi:TonB-linked outer membrane protein, SusC/RagA family [Olivibacter domesticus]|uniref:TonB-linked outer membrane protein, SusC/RagA family n=2 Tax=Olivibacter domesticus TaxID=407022 RepID=A0A1H7R1Y2_OLID1|nr:TonB-linked outer membrane protein, SusC/RagA family [Olivibacter domesticus]
MAWARSLSEFFGKPSLVQHRTANIKRKIIMRFNLTFFFLFIALMQLRAATYAQKISVNKQNVTLEEVFWSIKQQSDYVFVYNSKEIKNLKVSINAQHATVEEIMRECLRNQPFTYKITGHNVMIKRKSETFQASPFLQQREVKGKVIDAQGLPVPGVSIQIKGTTAGTTTNAEGLYTLRVSGADATLVFSILGYALQEITVGSNPVVNVTLKEEPSALDEVVVVGYGTQRRADVTTAVASVSAEAIQNRPVQNFGEAIAGQMAGVQVQQTSGAPGGEGLSIKVRGTGSITQSNDPLYVVDGYPMEGNAFRLINPSDIESIQVLKDASSTAIYGSRGANGVVVISTKKGKKGPPTINVNSFVGFQQRGKEIEMMNRDQYVDWFIDGRNQAWLDAAVIPGDPNQSPHSINDPNARRSLYPGASGQYMIPDGTGGYKYNFMDPASVATMPDNNWQDLLYRTALTQQNELSVNGGSENTQYNFSGSYMKQDGIVINTDYDRFNFRSAINSKVSKTINLGVNLMAYSAQGREQDEGKYSAVMYALQLPPIYPERNADGTYGSMVRNPETLVGDVASPLGVANLVNLNRRRYGWLGTISADWEIMKDLKYRLSINGGIQDDQLKRFEPSIVDLDASKAPRPAKGVDMRNTDYDWVIENTLNYTKTFGEKHNFSALVGYTTQKHTKNYMNGEARGFANDDIETLNAGNMYALSSTESAYSMISYLSRVNYSYDDRYLFTATLRSDGSSRFGQNRKWGTFPSVSVGWRISEEEFMKNVDQISDLKLRAGYGISGNNRIGDYSAIGLLSPGYYPTGGTLQNTVDPSTIPNNDLGWEKTRQYNLGFEFGLANDRVRVEGDFYDSQSVDLLLNVPVPTITGYTSQIQNVGKVQNRGMEFSVTTRNFINKFQWSTNFNISFNKNKVLEVGPDQRPIYGSAPNANNAFITTIGLPIASFYGYKQEGVFMSQEELDRYPHLAADKIGDGRYADVNGDGKLDQNDKTILGNNMPDFTAGITNNFSYKNFSLSVQFTGSYGAEVFSFFKRMVGIYHGDRNGMIEQIDRWRSPEEPGDGIHFRATRNPTGWQRDPSSAWVQNASYLRLRNVNFSYNFGQPVLDKLKIKGLRLYVTGSNLFTITDYSGYDPETGSESGLNQDGTQKSGLQRGGDYLGYPTARSFIFGANLTF